MSRSERLVASAFCYASVIVFACAHACVFSYFFSRFGGFLFFMNICSVSMEARLDVVGLWVEEGFGLGRGGTCLAL